MTTFEKAYETVLGLVNTFTQNYNHYMSAGYSESAARQDYIDKFFAALGWDVTHQYQTNPYEQEVKIELSQKQQNETAHKRADYAFYKAPNYKEEVFFVEAKKPSVLINKNAQHYFQTIKYGWNAGCPLSVLTDFEEFVIIDCRNIPNIKYALNGNHKSYRFTDYATKEKFAEIYWLFSKEAVANNSIKKYADALPKAKGKVTQKALFKGSYMAIDDSFLAYIDGVRENLAKAFKNNDDTLTGEQLTEAVQRTVDRLVFIRFLEDKFIEPNSLINEWGLSPSVGGVRGGAWDDFVADCRKLDAKYNGVVFKKHFIDEQTFVGPQQQLFFDICQEISSLNSPYDFNYIPIHILGSIYERFLGKVIRVTNKRSFVEEKPEVRKAGGVYYTPKYIVDYIVINTVGKQIQGKTPKQIADLRFADIACGSGSFLIGVYDCLLEYHKKYYTEKLKDKTELDKRSEDYGNVMYQDKLWQLTLKLKQTILLNNIYGVDIDAQAVEVTQLSLFLKMLEDESLTSTQSRQGSVFSKVLPNLSNNIVCGNSLIGFDIMQQTSLTFGEGLEGEAELKKLNPMDYAAKFPAIMRGGGFDAIVGNPPYVSIENLDENTKAYFFNHYKTCKGRTDIYIPFFEKILTKLLKQNGFLCYIIPYAFTNQVYGEALRVLLAKNYWVKEIVDSSSYYVFKEAKVKNITITIQKKYADNLETQIRKVLNPRDFEIGIFEDFNIQQSQFLTFKQSRFETKQVANLLSIKETICKDIYELKDICLVAYGARLNYKKKSIGKEVFIHKEYSKGFKLFVEGKNINRYEFTQAGWLNYQPKLHYNSMFPELFENEKIMFINVVKEKLRFTYDDKGFYNSHTVCNCIRICDLKNAKHITARKVTNNVDLSISESYSLKFILGILNSNLISWYFHNFLSESLHFYPGDAQKLPIPKIKKSNEKAIGQVILLVTQLITAKQQQAQAITEKDKNFITNKCQSLDAQIDNLVYQLYNLTEAEIKIVEGN